MTENDLKRVYYMNKNIQRRIDKIDALRSAIGNSAVRYDTDPVQSSSGLDRLERVIAEIVDLEREVDEMTDRYIAYKGKMIANIDKIPSERDRDVLYSRYILFMQFTDIADDLHLDASWVRKIHKRAIDKYVEKPKKTTKCCG